MVSPVGRLVPSAFADTRPMSGNGTLQALNPLSCGSLPGAEAIYATSDVICAAFMTKTEAEGDCWPARDAQLEMSNAKKNCYPI